MHPLCIFLISTSKRFRIPFQAKPKNRNLQNQNCPESTNYFLWKILAAQSLSKILNFKKPSKKKSTTRQNIPSSKTKTQPSKKKKKPSQILSPTINKNTKYPSKKYSAATLKTENSPGGKKKIKKISSRTNSMNQNLLSSFKKKENTS